MYGQATEERFTTLGALTDPIITDWHADETFVPVTMTRGELAATLSLMGFVVGYGLCDERVANIVLDAASSLVTSAMVSTDTPDTVPDWL